MLVYAHVYPITVMVIMFITSVTYTTVLAPRGLLNLTSFTSTVRFEHNLVKGVFLTQLQTSLFSPYGFRFAKHGVNISQPSNYNTDRG